MTAADIAFNTMREERDGFRDENVRLRGRINVLEDWIEESALVIHRLKIQIRELKGGGISPEPE